MGFGLFHGSPTRTFSSLYKSTDFRDFFPLLLRQSAIMGQDNEPSRLYPPSTPSTPTNALSFAETYRYNETPVYTASNGCPVHPAHVLLNRMV